MSVVEAWHWYYEHLFCEKYIEWTTRQRSHLAVTVLLIVEKPQRE
jgi:hypothetical protein